METILQYNVVDLFVIDLDSEKYLISIDHNGKSQKFKVGSDAKFSLLGEDEFTLFNLKISIKKARHFYPTQAI